MTVDFQRGGSSDLELRFSFPQELEQSIKEELAERGRATPTFECKDMEDCSEEGERKEGRGEC